MISPSPTQQQPEWPELEPKPEQKKVSSTPLRKRPGQSPTARFLKSFFRPIFKSIYYLIQGIRQHKLVALLALILFLGGATLANYMVTKTLPFGIGTDDPVQSLSMHDGASGTNVRNWLYALRDGDTGKMTQIQQGLIMQTAPDPKQLVSQYSKDHITWKDISVLSANVQPDTTIDTFVKVNIIAPGQSGTVNAFMIWHFATLPQQGGRVLTIDLVSVRQNLQ